MIKSYRSLTEIQKGSIGLSVVRCWMDRGVIDLLYDAMEIYTKNGCFSNLLLAESHDTANDGFQWVHLSGLKKPSALQRQILVDHSRSQSFPTFFFT